MIRSLDAPGAVDDLLRRLARLDVTSARRWGTLTASQMLCHLSDAFLALLGERQASASKNWLWHNAGKWYALHTSLPWPHGIQTRPEADPTRLGTQPGAFDVDRRTLIALILRCARPETRHQTHPIFGPLTQREWHTWAYRHVDYHLRQFGL